MKLESQLNWLERSFGFPIKNIAPSFARVLFLAPLLVSIPQTTVPYRSSENDKIHLSENLFR